MRAMWLAAALLMLGGPVGADEASKGEQKKAAEGDAKAADEGPPKPAVRTVQVRSSIFQFKVRFDPGVPEPGEVVEARIEMAEVPPVPDPVYGETIPIKGAAIVAEVTDADGAGYGLAYRVHPLTDAGMYGFHFTPARSDVYRVVLRGEQKSQRYAATIRVPVGIWPLPGGEDEQPADKGGPGLAALPGGRGPAVPAGHSGGPAIPGSGPAQPGGGPAQPGGGPAGDEAKGGESPLHEAMETMGEHWVALQVALLAGRRPDLNKARLAADALRRACLAAVDVAPGDADHARLMKATAAAVGAVAKATAGKKAKPALRAYRQVGARHCNRCHFARRWEVLSSPDEFPAMLP